VKSLLFASYHIISFKGVTSFIASIFETTSKQLLSSFFSTNNNGASFFRNYQQHFWRVLIMASQFSEDAVAAADKEMEERATRAKELLANRYHGLKNQQVSLLLFSVHFHPINNVIVKQHKNDTS
jgi:hypothetical protein